MTHLSYFIVYTVTDRVLIYDRKRKEKEKEKTRDCKGKSGFRRTCDTVNTFCICTL